MGIIVSYLYRHNSVLKHIISVARSGLSKSDPDGNVSIFHDIAGEAGFSKGTTIPTECSPTNLIPDLVIFWKNIKKVLILGLTVPFAHGIDRAHQFKSNKYWCLESKIIIMMSPTLRSKSALEVLSPVIIATGSNNFSEP